MIVRMSPTNDRDTPIYVTISTAKCDGGGVPVLADISYIN